MTPTQQQQARVGAADAAYDSVDGPIPKKASGAFAAVMLEPADSRRTAYRRHNRGRCNPSDCLWCACDGERRRTRSWRDDFVAHLANPDWQDDAACAGAESDLWFPERGAKVNAGHAKAVCADCRVQRECLHCAIYNNEKYGVWGGMTERERRHVGQQRRREPTE